MSNIAIRVEGLGKQYRIGQRERYKSLRDSIMRGLAVPYRRLQSLFQHPNGQASNGDGTIWALKDVSFEVKHGEVLGVIGRNGAGKSTLLKILSRIAEPTEGYADIWGRVGSLLEVGTGFHPELTGRENIYLNGAILGMTRREIARKFDEIVAFAEIEKFLDTAVKHYSSGMYMRLAFAVAAHLEPEILVVDEVLAVGDAAFQKKCLGKMGDIASGGRTVLFVSHNLTAIAQLCQRALWIDCGKLRNNGSASDTVASYLLSETAVYPSCIPPRSQKESTADVELNNVRLVPSSPVLCGTASYSSDFQIEISYRIRDYRRNLSIFLRLHDCQGNVLLTTWDTDTTEWKGRARAPGKYLSTCTIPRGLLRPGRYLVSIGAHVPNVRSIVYIENVLGFEIAPVGYPLNPDRVGIICPLLHWEVTHELGTPLHF
jgi:lipopolysaccharide transport system ATP-binding protein